jgi:RecJ-like exonuclease
MSGSDEWFGGGVVNARWVRVSCGACKGHGAIWGGVTDAEPCDECGGRGSLPAIKCEECGRIWDFADESDEIKYGHDCEVTA